MGTIQTDSKQEEDWLRNFDRKLDYLEDNQTSFNSSFLDPRQLELAEKAIGKRQALSYTVFGGYPDAERNMIYIFPAHQASSLPGLSIILIEWSTHEPDISQRDILGSIMSLGLKRDQVGDIVVTDDHSAFVMIEESKAFHICSNLTRAGAVSLKCSIVDSSKIKVIHDKGKEIKGTVASLRIDSVLSLGFGVPRSRVVLLVKNGLTRVNWRAITSPSFILKEGDQISLKGKGRLVITSVEGETRKGRTRLKLKKYS